jgi:hypothetical protein
MRQECWYSAQVVVGPTTTGSVTIAAAAASSPTAAAAGGGGAPPPPLSPVLENMIKHGLLVLPTIRLSGMISNFRTLARFAVAEFMTEVYAEAVGTFVVSRHDRFHVARYGGSVLIGIKLIVAYGFHVAAQFVVIRYIKMTVMKVAYFSDMCVKHRFAILY